MRETLFEGQGDGRVKVHNNGFRLIFGGHLVVGHEYIIPTLCASIVSIIGNAFFLFRLIASLSIPIYIHQFPIEACVKMINYTPKHCYPFVGWRENKSLDDMHFSARVTSVIMIRSHRLLEHFPGMAH